MKLFIVLGMHRSGTSALGNALRDSGVDMGKPSHDGSESEDFVSLNGKILTHAGGDWKNPPSKKAIMATAQKLGGSIKRVIAKNKNDEAWGFKDPRSTLTIEALIPHVETLTDDYVIYACFRKPEHVAQSLENRGIPHKKG